MSKLAGKLHRDQGSPQSHRVVWSGQFVTAGAGAPTGVKGAGFTVTKEAGAGLYTIRLDRSLTDFLELRADLLGATSNSQSARVLSQNLDAGDFDTLATFQIETHSVEGTEANLTGPIVTFGVVGHIRAP